MISARTPRIGARRIEGAVQFFDGRAIQSVQDLRPIDGDPRDLILYFVQ